MFRKLAILVSFALALSASARTRAIVPNASAPLAQTAGASVTGEVATVTGNIITLAGGLVSIDASSAKILLGEGTSTLSAIRPGALIVATVQENASTSGPLVATAIGVLRNADVTLTGTTQSVDVAGNQFALLGRTIKTDSNTSFVNFGRTPSLAGLSSNMLVLVEANAVGNTLVASRVILVSPIPTRPQAANGTVKSVGTDAWVVTVGSQDLTFVVNTSTKILGSPKAGDRVDVLYTVDTAHSNVALSIIKSMTLPKSVTFTGVVKSITDDHWVITRESDKKDVVVKWPITVRISPAARVGDRVEVVGVENADGTYTAALIIPKR